MDNGKKCIYPVEEFTQYKTTGLTKREYFAGLALQGVLSNSDTYNLSPETAASHCIACADALLSELEK